MPAVKQEDCNRAKAGTSADSLHASKTYSTLLFFELASPRCQAGSLVAGFLSIVAVLMILSFTGAAARGKHHHWR